jgi:hypothetical protein
MARPASEQSTGQDFGTGVQAEPTSVGSQESLLKRLVFAVFNEERSRSWFDRRGLAQEIQQAVVSVKRERFDVDQAMVGDR